MLNFTRRRWNEYCKRVARLNQIITVVEQFTVTPEVQQTLEQEIQLSVEFLQKINMVTVAAQTGEKVGIGVSGPIASRTDTSGNKERNPRDVSTTKARKYFCNQINYDTFISYAKLDAWAHKPDFQILLRNAIVIRQALDRIMIGWNGTHAADDTDLTTNPNLEDVAPGWLQKLRTEAPMQVMSGIQIGGTGKDYDSLDGLVYDAKNTLIKPWHRKDPNLVCIVGDELLTEKYLPLVDKQNAPTEKVALNELLRSLKLGGLDPEEAPFFPSHSILITRLDNLSIYVQRDARRRTILDAPKKNRIENIESSNDDFVVEDTDCAVLIENITFG